MTHRIDEHACHVAHAVRARDVTRDRLTDVALSTNYERDHVLAHIAAARHPRFGVPFEPLAETDIAWLECTMRALMAANLLVVLEQEHLNHQEPALEVLRMAQVCAAHHAQLTPGATDPTLLRRMATRAMREGIPHVLGRADPHRTVVVAIVRTGLIPAIAYYDAGIRTFGSITCHRDGALLQPIIERVVLPQAIATCEHLVLLDMVGATFGTLTTALVRIARDADRPETDMMVTAHLLDIAPEGAVPFLVRFPRARIVTSSRSTHLDGRGMLTDIGIGDADNLLMDDVDWSDGYDDLVRRGIIDADTLTYMLRRTRDEARDRQRSMTTAV